MHLFNASAYRFNNVYSCIMYIQHMRCTSPEESWFSIYFDKIIFSFIFLKKTSLLVKNLKIFDPSICYFICLIYFNFISLLLVIIMLYNVYVYAYKYKLATSYLINISRGLLMKMQEWFWSILSTPWILKFKYNIKIWCNIWKIKLKNNEFL